MKPNIPLPDEMITGLPALKLLQTKPKRDRRFFNKLIQKSRKGNGVGVSMFPTYERNGGLSFEVGFASSERIDGLEFCLYRYNFPSGNEGELKSELRRDEIFDVLGRGIS